MNYCIWIHPCISLGLWCTVTVVEGRGCGFGEAAECENGWGCSCNAMQVLSRGLYSSKGGGAKRLGGHVSKRAGLCDPEGGAAWARGWGCVTKRVGLYDPEGGAVWARGWDCVTKRAGLCDQEGGAAQELLYHSLSLSGTDREVHSHWELLHEGEPDEGERRASI